MAALPWRGRCASERDARLKKAASEAEEEIAAYRAAKEAEYQAEVDKVWLSFA